MKDTQAMATTPFSGTACPPMLGCVSHSPLIKIRPQTPAFETKIERWRADFEAQVHAFAPDQIVLFANNHFAGFHYANMPAYSVGVRCEAVDDLGGEAGTLAVPERDALALLADVRRAGFDPAVSYKMTVDHGVSQPLARLVGGLDRYPVIPIFISVFTPPLLPFSRSRLFGQAVGRHLAASGRKTLILGSGGLSHHPAFIFPPMDEATPEVLGYQTAGAQGGTMTDAQWFDRFDQLHIGGAQAIVDGLLTKADLRLNETFDRHFLDLLGTGQLEEMDNWDQIGDLLPRAGMGSWEVHSWIAAAAAYRAAGGHMPVQTHYQLATEYGVGYGMAVGV